MSYLHTSNSPFFVTWGDYLFGTGTRGADTMIGSDETRDFFYGGFGDDRLEGLGGQDFLAGGRGTDSVFGGAGVDTLYGNSGDDLVDGGEGDDFILGGSGDDQLEGGEGNDWLLGERGDDVVSGGAGQDTLRGDRGDDRLSGGEGDDVLRGGSGADVFVFAAGDGADQIIDFSQGVDRIEITSGAASFDELVIEQAGNDVIVEFGDVTVRINSQDPSDFDASDFLF